jgi:hypothetical protein
MMDRLLRVAAMLCALPMIAVADEPASYRNLVSPDGSFSLPAADFRRDWTALGVWSVAGDEGTEGLHVVYTTPDVVDSYRESGQFPDGAVLVKELLGAETEDMTTGTVSHATEVEGWFVMIKDADGRFPENPLWGHGWGWAFFEASDRITTTTGDYEAECLGCHVPAEETDWVYVQGYPVLDKSTP